MADDLLDARARVDAFVAGYHRAWQSLSAADNDLAALTVQLVVWRRRVTELARRHGTPRFLAAFPDTEAGTLAWPARHDPVSEQIIDVTIADAKAVVSSSNGSPHAETGTTWFEYRLVRDPKGWLIDDLHDYPQPPEQPLVAFQDRAALERLPQHDAELMPLPKGWDLDVDALFASGEEARTSAISGVIDVVTLGSMATAGAFVVCDPNEVLFDVVPLTRRVAPGEYPVEVSRVDGRNVAVRVRLSDEPAHTWHPAENSRGGFAVDVDTGLALVADLDHVLACRAREIEDQAFDMSDDRLLNFHGTGQSHAAIVGSGWGDGGYPAWWGVAADGSPSCLVVDFLVLAEDVTEVVDVPWSVGQDMSEEVIGLSVAHSGSGYAIAHHDMNVRDIRVFGSDGTMLVDCHHLALRVIGTEHSHQWVPDNPPPDGSIMALTVSRGTRHQFRAE